MNRRLLGILALSISALLATGWVILSRPSDQTESSPAGPASGTDQGPTAGGDCAAIETFAGREDCLRELLETTSRTEGAEPAAELLGEVLAENPRMRELCQQPSHAIAAVLPPPTLQELTAAMASSTMQVCDWGVIQGLLVRFASSVDDITSLSGVLSVCGQLPDPGAKIGCSASVGHALFEFTGDFAIAARECAGYEELLRDCVSGVFVQFFSPVAPSDRGESVGSSLPIEELPQFCDLGDRDLDAACYRATHYAYSQVLGPIRYEMSRAKDPAELFEARFLPAYREGAEFCLSFPEYGGYGCAEEMSRMALQLVATLDEPSFLDKICAATPPAAAEFCGFARSGLNN